MKKNESAKQAKAKEKQEIAFPYTYSKYSVSVKIYKTPRQDYDAFTLIYYQDGERKRVLFSTFEAALKEAEEVAKLLGSKDVDVLELRSADRASYKRARELLDPLSVSLEVATAQYAHARTLLGDTPLSAAVDFYVRRHPSKIEHKPVGAVVAEFLAAKQADGCGARYLQCLRYNLGAFVKRFQGNIGAVAGGEVDAWLRASGLSPRTRNNIRTSMYTLFKFAEGRRYLPKDHDELDSVSVVNDREGDIEVFTSSELTEILCCASEAMMPFLTVGAFAGIRHAEIQRLEWKDIRFDDGSIEIRASKAKTASRRLVPIVPNLKEWLLKYRQPSGLVVTQRNASFELHLIAKRANQFRRATWATAHGITDEQLEQAEKRAREEAANRKAKSKLRSQKGEVPPGAETAEIEGWEPFAWKHNALRHSFISYRLATVPNTAQVALEAGNSPQMIFRHYRELVRPADAEKWFGIAPEAVEAARKRRSEVGGQRPENVVALPKVAAA
jgi:integrase